MSAALAERPRGLRRFVTLFRLWRREAEEPGAVLRAARGRGRRGLRAPLRAAARPAIVDLGCGPGFYTRALRQRGADVIPVDNDPDELELAGEPPEGALLADATALPFEDASVDGVLCSNMLEHTPNAEAVVAEIERVLRPRRLGLRLLDELVLAVGRAPDRPYHYLGPRLGPRVYERFHGPPRKNRLRRRGCGRSTSGRRCASCARARGWRSRRVEPRYWPRLAFIGRIPLVRELLTWNCVIRMRKLG